MMSSRPVGAMHTEPVSCPAMCLHGLALVAGGGVPQDRVPAVEEQLDPAVGQDRVGRSGRLVRLGAEAPDALDEPRGRTLHRLLGVPHRIPFRCAISSSPSAKRSR